MQKGVHIQTFWLALTRSIVGTHPFIRTVSAGPTAPIVSTGFSFTIGDAGTSGFGFRDAGESILACFYEHLHAAVSNDKHIGFLADKVPYLRLRGGFCFFSVVG